MEASFFSKPLSQSECRHNKKSCHLLDKKGTHPMRMHDNNTTCNRSNQNASLPDTQLLNQSASSCSRHSKNHVLPKRGTMLKSIPCFVCRIGWPPNAPPRTQLPSQLTSHTPSPGNGISTGNSLISSVDLDSPQKFSLDWYLFLNGCLQITLIQIYFWYYKTI